MKFLKDLVIGKVIELREHQQAALASLQTMRDQGESIALLYHATGTGKTVTAVSDAKRLLLQGVDTMQIKPSASIRQNYHEIAALCKSSEQPVPLKVFVNIFLHL